MRNKHPGQLDLDNILESLGWGVSIENAVRRANVDLKAFTALRKQFPEIRAAVNSARVNGLMLRASRMRKRADGLERDAAKIKRFGDQLAA